MKYAPRILAVIAALLLTACGHDDVGTHTNFQPAYDTVAKATTANNKAVATAQAIAKTGSKPGDTNSVAIVQETQAVAKALVDTQTSLVSVQKQADAQADADAKADAELKASTEARRKHWLEFLTVSVVFVGLLVVAAPAIVVMAGSGVTAFLAKIPVIGGFLSEVEEVAGLVVGLVIVLAAAGLLTVFGVL